MQTATPGTANTMVSIFQVLAPPSWLDCDAAASTRRAAKAAGDTDIVIQSSNTQYALLSSCFSGKVVAGSIFFSFLLVLKNNQTVRSQQPELYLLTGHALRLQKKSDGKGQNKKRGR